MVYRFIIVKQLLVKIACQVMYSEVGVILYPKQTNWLIKVESFFFDIIQNELVTWTSRVFWVHVNLSK